MGCESCPSHQSGPDVFVDIVLRGDGYTKFEGISMSKLNAPGRTLQFEDQDGYLHIIMLGANDRVEITSCEPLPTALPTEE